MEHLEMVVEGYCLCAACIDERAAKLFLVYGVNAETLESFLQTTATSEEEAEEAARLCSLESNVLHASVQGAYHQNGCWDYTIYTKGTRLPFVGTPICKK